MGPADESGSGEDQRRVPPNGQAWQEAQRRVRERNDSARKAGKEERVAAEQRVAEFERDEQQRGIVQR